MHLKLETNHMHNLAISVVLTLQPDLSFGQMMSV